MDSKKEDTMNRKFHFDLLFFKRFLKIVHMMFPTWKSVHVLMCIFLLGLGLLEQVVIFNIGYIPSQYYKVFGDKDMEGFRDKTIFAVVLIISEAFILSTSKYLTSVLYITWRGAITTAVHKLYFTDILYYDINVLSNIDNPDQRIAQDVERLCLNFSQIFSPLLISPFTICYYLYKSVQSTGYLGPVGVLSFFLLATIINKFLMSPVVNYVFKREQMEGNFRFKHMQIRVNAESAAFYRSGNLERAKSNRKLQKLLKTQHRLVAREYALNFSVNLFDYLGSILSYILLAFPIFHGKYDGLSPTDLSTLISQNAFVIIYLINCFTRLIDLSVKVADLAGNAHRIGELIEELKTQKAEREVSYKFLEHGVHTDSGDEVNLTELLVVSDSAQGGHVQLAPRGFSVADVTYGTPKGTDVLCRSVTFQFEAGMNILITGDSGCGKSSLLRVIVGMWPTITGDINFHQPLDPQKLLFLPQKPYFTDGSLRQQVLYPLAEQDQSADDEKILQYLNLVGLNSILERTKGLDMEMDWNWYDELSPGEMQRLSFVRLFFHQPHFGVLDEATSQVGIEAEHMLYKTCQDLNITLLSVGHRTSLRQFHEMELHLDGQGGWTMQPIRDNVISESCS